MSLWLELLITILMLIGAFFTLMGSFTLVRLPDFFMRLHGPAKATSLGVGSMAVASAVYFSNATPGISLHELTLAVFLFITAPLSAHLLAKATLHTSKKPDDAEDLAPTD